GVKAVVVPTYASEFSALAIATSEMLVVNKTSSPMVGPFDATAVRDVFMRLETDAVDQLRRAGAVTNGGGDLAVLRAADMKYKGQVHDVSVPVPAGEYTADSAVA